MDRVEKLELIQRSLGIRHKLKVHDSMKPPETHEDLAISLMSRWELEDELRAIEEMLSEERQENVGRKRKILTREYLGSHSKPASTDEIPTPAKASSKKRKG